MDFSGGSRSSLTGTSPGRCQSKGRARNSVWGPVVGAALVLSILPGLAWTVVAQSHAPKPLILPEANRPPDANEQMVMRENQAKKHNYEAANVERTRQINADSEMLLKLAMQVKDEMDKADKDGLSIEDLRRVEAIERLAHGVKEKMKLTVGPS